MSNVIAFPPAPRCAACGRSTPSGVRLCPPCAGVWREEADGTLVSMREEPPPAPTALTQAARALESGTIRSFWPKVE